MIAGGFSFAAKNKEPIKPKLISDTNFFRFKILNFWRIENDYNTSNINKFFLPGYHAFVAYRKSKCLQQVNGLKSIKCLISYDNPNWQQK